MLENNLWAEFRLRSKPLLGYPVRNAWEALLIMQQHGFPTRLLDWSRTMSVAAYFAVRGGQYENVDGALWVMAGRRLMELRGVPGAWKTLVGDPALEQLKLRGTENETETFEGIVPAPLIPDFVSPRMITQRCIYTLHTFERDVLDKLALKDKEEYGPARFLHKIIIPAEIKAEMRGALSVLASKVWSMAPGPIPALIRWCNDLAKTISSDAPITRMPGLEILSVGEPLQTIPDNVLAALHDKVTHDGIAIRHTANGTTALAECAEPCRSDAHDARQLARREIDPLAGQQHASDADAYAALRDLTPERLDDLLEMLIVGMLTGHAARPTPLIKTLCDELNVNVRENWKPDAAWLSGYQKCQLAHLWGELRGPEHVHAATQAKKSELVERLAKLFADADAGTLDDAELTARVKAWVPASMCERDEVEADDEKAIAA